MKILRGLTALLFVVLVLASCSDDDESTSYDKAQFEGTWELSNSTSADYEECSTNPPMLEVNDTNIVFPVIGSEGCDSGDLETEFEFNGQAYIVNFLGQSITYTIVSASENEFVWEDNFEGAQETWVRVN
jgi:hypothetical protein